MDRRYDPRSIVTPYAFAVHPDLVGRPLATPWQRLGAILLDLAVILFLTRAIPGVLLALASALLLFWLAIRKPGRDALGKAFRIFVGCLGLLVLAVTVGILLLVRYRSDLEQWGEEVGQRFAQEAGVPSDSLDLGPPAVELRDILQVVQEAAAFQGVTSREEAQAIANRLARNALELNMSRQDIRASLAGLIPQDAPWAEAGDSIVEKAMDSLPPVHPPPTPASEATPGSAEERADHNPPEASIDAFALDSIHALNQELAQEREARSEAEAEARTARQALEDAESRGLLSWLYELIDDLGLGFGWGALYLTVTHAWWKGTSVGKRLFRIRVVMIDQRPLNWWLSFERAGGYAAGFATGLLGFAQIFWDPNRQAIHDKVSETIVIQDGKPAVPGPWIEEGRAMWTGRRKGTL